MCKKDQVDGRLEHRQEGEREDNTVESVAAVRLGPFVWVRGRRETRSRGYRERVVSVHWAVWGLFGFLLAVLVYVL